MPISALMALSYAAFAIFVIVVASKWIKWSTMPMHLRWELYPVPHEAGRHHYGGSYIEEIDYWKKPRETTLAGELKDMFAEMLFIKRVYQHKRPLWWLTYPFHAGIYLILAWFFLLFVHGILSVYISIPALATIVYYLIQICGTIGIIAATIGCIGLIIRRFSDKDMGKYTVGVEMFNLFFILIVLLTGIATWITYDPHFQHAMEFMKALVAFNAAYMPKLTTIAKVHVVLLCLLWIYIPFTKMSHFVGKYFTFHKVLWEDEPNLKGSEIEAKVRELTKLPMPWSAPHIDTGKSWDENALESPKDEWGRWRY